MEHRIRLKCRLGSEVRNVMVTTSTSMEDLLRRLGPEWIGAPVSLKYSDAEGDWCLLATQDDLVDLVEYDTRDSIPILVTPIHPTNTLSSIPTPSTEFTLPSLGGGGTSLTGAGLMSQSTLPRMSLGTSFPHIDSRPSNTPVVAAGSLFPTLISPNGSMQAINNGNTGEIHWKKGEILGQGAIGVVYLGLNTDTGELMAVKQITTDEVSIRELNSLENEIRLLRTLRHPNIVRYIGTELTAQRCSIFLEYVSGGSLRALIDKFGALEESVTRSYTRQLCLGLEYLHCNGIAHRDIKGANCLVGNDGVIKLADFGNSKRWHNTSMQQNTSMLPSMLNGAGRTGSESLEARPGVLHGTQTGEIKGTPAWMAPEVVQEQVTKQSINWRKADIWSLACTTIEMVTGFPPWKQFNNPVTVMYHLACQDTLPEFPTNCSTELHSFLITCLMRSPNQRPDVMSLLLHPFVSSSNSWNPSVSTASHQGYSANDTHSVMLNSTSVLGSTQGELWSPGSQNPSLISNGTINGAGNCGGVWATARPSTTSSIIREPLMSSGTRINSGSRLTPNGNISSQQAISIDLEPLRPVLSTTGLPINDQISSAALTYRTEREEGASPRSIGASVVQPGSVVDTSSFNHEVSGIGGGTSGMISATYSMDEEYMSDVTAGDTCIQDLSLIDSSVLDVEMHGVGKMLPPLLMTGPSVSSRIVLEPICTTTAPNTTIPSNTNAVTSSIPSSTASLKKRGVKSANRGSAAVTPSRTSSGTSQTSPEKRARKLPGRTKRSTMQSRSIGKSVNSNGVVDSRVGSEVDDAGYESEASNIGAATLYESGSERALNIIGVSGSVVNSVVGGSDTSVTTSPCGGVSDGSSPIDVPSVVIVPSLPDITLALIPEESAEGSGANTRENENITGFNVKPIVKHLDLAKLSPREKGKIDNEENNVLGINGSTTEWYHDESHETDSIICDVSNNAILPNVGEDNIVRNVPAKVTTTTSVDITRVESMDSICFPPDGIFPTTSMESHIHIEQLNTRLQSRDGDLPSSARESSDNSNANKPHMVSETTSSPERAKKRQSGSPIRRSTQSISSMSANGVSADATPSGEVNLRAKGSSSSRSRNVSSSSSTAPESVNTPLNPFISPLIRKPTRPRRDQNIGSVNSGVDVSCDSIDSLHVSGIPTIRHSVSIISSSERNSARIREESEAGCDQQDEEDITSLNFSTVTPTVLDEHTAPISRLRIGSGGKLLLSASLDGTLRLWSNSDSKSRLTLEFCGNGSRPVSRIARGETSGGDTQGESVVSESSLRSTKIVASWSDEPLEQIVAAGNDSTLRYWQVSSQDARTTPLRVLRGHEDLITCMEGLEPSPGGSTSTSGSIGSSTGAASGGGVMSSSTTLIATGSMDRTVRIWDHRCRRGQVFVLRGHGDSILTLKWIENGRALVSGGKDRTIRIWDPRAGRMRATCEKHFGAVTMIRALDGSTNGARDAPVFASAGRDSMLNFWSATGDCVVSHSAAHRGHIVGLSDSRSLFTSLASLGMTSHFNSNENRPTTTTGQLGSHATSTHQFISIGSDNHIKLWDVRRGRCLAELPTSLCHAPSVPIFTPNHDTPTSEDSSVGMSAPVMGLMTRAVWTSAQGKPSFVTSSSTGQIRCYTARNDLTEWHATDLAGAGTDVFTGTCSSQQSSITDLVSGEGILAAATKSGRILRWTF